MLFTYTMLFGNGKHWQERSYWNFETGFVSMHGGI